MQIFYGLEMLISSVMCGRFVVNYDLPNNLDEFVHRSGRTGRAGRAGHVLNFVCWQDRKNARQLIEILERSNAVRLEQLVPIHGTCESSVNYVYHISHECATTLELRPLSGVTGSQKKCSFLL